MNNETAKKPELVAMGIKLKDLRIEESKSQKEASKSLGIKPSVLSSYEIGDREPPCITLNKIARYYGVTVDYLTGNSEHRNYEHKELSKTLPTFNEKAIESLMDLNIDSDGLFEEVVVLESFSLLFRQLKRYQNLPPEEIDAYGKNIFGEDCKNFRLKIAITGNDLKKDICKPTLERFMNSLLEDIDKIDKRKRREDILIDLGIEINNLYFELKNATDEEHIDYLKELIAEKEILKKHV